MDVVNIDPKGAYSLNSTQETMTAAYTWTGLDIEALVPVDDGCTGTLLNTTGETQLLVQSVACKLVAPREMQAYIQLCEQGKIATPKDRPVALRCAKRAAP
jgi:hypothetical protein